MSKMVSFHLESILWKFCLEDGRNRDEGQWVMRNFIALHGWSRMFVYMPVWVVFFCFILPNINSITGGYQGSHEAWVSSW